MVYSLDLSELIAHLLIDVADKLEEFKVYGMSLGKSQELDRHRWAKD